MAVPVPRCSSGTLWIGPVPASVLALGGMRISTGCQVPSNSRIRGLGLWQRACLPCPEHVHACVWWHVSTQVLVLALQEGERISVCTRRSSVRAVLCCFLCA